MGYRIEYDQGSKLYEIKKEHPLRFPAMIGGCFMLFLLLTWVCWPEGAEHLQEMLIPGDNAATTQALDGMVERLKSGMHISEALTTFCREIICGA